MNRTTKDLLAYRIIEAQIHFIEKSFKSTHFNHCNESIFVLTLSGYDKPIGKIHINKIKFLILLKREQYRVAE